MILWLSVALLSLMRKKAITIPRTLACYTLVDANTVIVGGVTMVFNGFILRGQGGSSGSGGGSEIPTTIGSAPIFLPDVSGIIQQPDVNAADNGSQDGNGDNSVAQNIDQLVTDSIKGYDAYLSQIKLNPYCFQN